MDSIILLQKLIDIERSIGIETESIIRHRILDAQDFLMRMREDDVVDLLQSHFEN